MRLSRSMWYYEHEKDDSMVIKKLSELAVALPTRGFDSYYGRIRAEGIKWNRKRVLRVYRMLKLQKRRSYKRRLPDRVKEPLEQPLLPNVVWSADFMHDVLSNGRKIRVLNIIDDYNREALWVDVHFSYPGFKVVEALEILSMERGLPQSIRVDNGPEFIGKDFKQFCEEKGIRVQYIQPGKPTQNAYIERFNRTYREDILDAYLFEDIHQVNQLSKQWMKDYNNHHPHKALGGMSPKKYSANAQQVLTVENSIEFTTINTCDDDNYQ